MEAVNYKCPGCGNSLVFKPEHGLLYCDSCSQYFQVKIPYEYNVKENTDNVAQPEEKPEYMDMRVYHCSSCGSEIMTNDTEVSNFCSYCGQPAIMFDRISKEKRPEKIIPFIITKEKAINIAREAFSHGKYSFDCMDSVAIDKVQGIYMPYWRYDTSITMEAEVEVREPKEKTRRYNQVTEFDHELFLDASRRFKDSVSIELNPFEYFSAEEFSPQYLSGFYADRSDVNSRDDDAKRMVEWEAHEKLLDKTPGVVSRSMRDAYTGFLNYRRYYDVNVRKTDYKINETVYMYLPVYFLTFILNNKTVIILVNGQTGKVFGSIPIDPKKFKKAQNRDRLICSVIFGIAGAILFRFMPLVWSGMLMTLIAIFTYNAGNKHKDEFFKFYKETNSEDMFELTKRNDK